MPHSTGIDRPQNPFYTRFCMKRSSRPALLSLLCVLLLAALPSVYGQNVPVVEDNELLLHPGPSGTGEGMTGDAGARKAIHIDSYTPVPGDRFEVYIDYGVNLLRPAESLPPRTFRILLYDDYNVTLPFVADPINVRGMTLGRLRREALSAISQGLQNNRLSAMLVTFELVSVSVFDVYAFGEVANPGAATVDSLTTLVGLLESEGLLTRNSSRRRVSLERDGQVTEYSILDYYQSANLDQNPLLRPGDVITVFPIEATVSISGAVGQPGRYEVLPGDTLGELIEEAGGFEPSADRTSIQVRRWDGAGNSVLLDLTYPDDARETLQPADVVTVRSSLEITERVLVEGALFGRPSDGGILQSIPTSAIRTNVAHSPGLTVLGVLDALGGPTPLAATEEAFVRRAEGGEVIDLENLDVLWRTRDATLDVPLEPGDRLVVPIQDLEVRIVGEVYDPRTVPFRFGRTVGDYLLEAGGINHNRATTNSVYLASARGDPTPVGLTAPVAPGSVISVETGGWVETEALLEDILTVTGLASGVVALVTSIVNLVNLLSP